MATHINPFTPRTPLGREMLEEYAQGRLSAEESHAVELLMESDPLLREALEGLQYPGALAALREIQAPKPADRGKWTLRIVVAALLIGSVGVYVATRPEAALVKENQHLTPTRQATAPTVIPAVVESTLQVVQAEINAVVDVEPAPSGTPSAERFEQATTTSVEREVIDRIHAQPVTLERTPGNSAPRTTREAKPSRQLVFLHGLKLVHPQELYGDGPPSLPSAGVPANVDPARPVPITSERASQHYLDFMDEAMSAIAKGHERAALDDLYFLLNQYPADVNAQFYAGLACYRLGLYPRALRLFHAAAGNPVDSFQEEATWYGALCLEKTDGRSASRPALERIARSGGFYAAQAKEMLGR